MFKYLKDFVELRTKVASVFPFIFVLYIYLYAFSAYNFSIGLAIIFFISMLCLDMATTVLNHLAGFSKEANMSIYDQKLKSQMKRLGLKNSFNKKILLTLVMMGIGFGLILVLFSNILVLVVGAVCVVVAVAYSFGPLPLKNTFLGELASGLTMGALIPLAFLLSQDPSLFITKLTPASVTLNLENIIIWAFILLVPIITIANIMLANNICDLDKDLKNGRLTLPIVIGLKPSLVVWNSGYVVCYIIIIGLILNALIPQMAMYGLVTIPFVVNNMIKFNLNPVKAKTFKYAVFNLQIILLAVIIPSIVYYLTYIK